MISIAILMALSGVAGQYSLLSLKKQPHVHVTADVDFNEAKALSKVSPEYTRQVRLVAPTDPEIDDFIKSNDVSFIIATARCTLRRTDLRFVNCKAENVFPQTKANELSVVRFVETYRLSHDDIPPKNVTIARFFMRLQAAGVEAPRCQGWFGCPPYMPPAPNPPAVK